MPCALVTAERYDFTAGPDSLGALFFFSMGMARDMRWPNAHATSLRPSLAHSLRLHERVRSGGATGLGKSRRPALARSTSGQISARSARGSVRRPEPGKG